MFQSIIAIWNEYIITISKENCRSQEDKILFFLMKNGDTEFEYFDKDVRNDLDLTLGRFHWKLAELIQYGALTLKDLGLQWNDKTEKLKRLPAEKRMEQFREMWHRMNEQKGKSKNDNLLDDLLEEI